MGSRPQTSVPAGRRPAVFLLAAILLLTGAAAVALRRWAGERRLAEARAAHERGDIRGAARRYREAAARGSDDAAVALARLAYARRDWDAVYRWVDRAAAMNPSRGYLSLLRAYALAAGEREGTDGYRAVLDECRRAVSLEPLNHQLWASYGDLAAGYYRAFDEAPAGLRDEVLQAYRQAVRFGPRESRRLLLDVDDTFGDAGLLLEIPGPGNGEALTEAVVILAERERWEAAAPEFWRRAAGDPQGRRLHLAAAAALLRTGSREEARTTLAEAEQLFGEDAEIDFQLAETADRSTEAGWRRAVERYERALFLDPENVTFLNTYGERSLRHGDPEKARRLLRRAVELDPRDHRAHYLLGSALEALGDQAGARERYRRALALLPGNAAYRRAAGGL